MTPSEDEARSVERSADWDQSLADAETDPIKKLTLQATANSQRHFFDVIAQGLLPPLLFDKDRDGWVMVPFDTALQSIQKELGESRVVKYVRMEQGPLDDTSKRKPLEYTFYFTDTDGKPFSVRAFPMGDGWATDPIQWITPSKASNDVDLPAALAAGALHTVETTGVRASLGQEPVADASSGQSLVAQRETSPNTRSAAPASGTFHWGEFFGLSGTALKWLGSVGLVAEIVLGTLWLPNHDLFTRVGIVAGYGVATHVLPMLLNKRTPAEIFKATGLLFLYAALPFFHAIPLVYAIVLSGLVVGHTMFDLPRMFTEYPWHRLEGDMQEDNWLLYGANNFKARSGETPLQGFILKWLAIPYAVGLGLYVTPILFAVNLFTQQGRARIARYGTIEYGANKEKKISGYWAMGGMSAVSVFFWVLPSLPFAFLSNPWVAVPLAVLSSPWFLALTASAYLIAFIVTRPSVWRQLDSSTESVGTVRGKSKAAYVQGLRDLLAEIDRGVPAIEAFKAAVTAVVYARLQKSTDPTVLATIDPSQMQSLLTELIIDLLPGIDKVVIEERLATPLNELSPALRQSVIEVLGQIKPDLKTLIIELSNYTGAISKGQKPDANEAKRALQSGTSISSAEADLMLRTVHRELGLRDPDPTLSFTTLETEMESPFESDAATKLGFAPYHELAQFSRPIDFFNKHLEGRNFSQTEKIILGLGIGVMAVAAAAFPVVAVIGLHHVLPQIALERLILSAASLALFAFSVARQLTAPASAPKAADQDVRMLIQLPKAVVYGFFAFAWVVNASPAFADFLASDPSDLPALIPIAFIFITYGIVSIPALLLEAAGKTPSLRKYVLRPFVFVVYGPLNWILHVLLNVPSVISGGRLLSWTAFQGSDSKLTRRDVLGGALFSLPFVGALLETSLLEAQTVLQSMAELYAVQGRAPRNGQPYELYKVNSPLRVTYLHFKSHQEMIRYGIRVMAWIDAEATNKKIYSSPDLLEAVIGNNVLNDVNSLHYAVSDWVDIFNRYVDAAVRNPSIVFRDEEWTLMEDFPPSRAHPQRRNGG